MLTLAVWLLKYTELTYLLIGIEWEEIMLFDGIFYLPVIENQKFDEG